jgi:hypothetical protein
VERGCHHGAEVLDPVADHHTLLKQVNNYQDTIFGLFAFLNECGWSAERKSIDPELNYGLGRRMDTSPENKVSPNNIVTPDLVVQKRTDLALVAEVKHSWSQESDWEDVIEQLQKYDDELKGWWTPSEMLPTEHDLVLLVHGSQVVKCVDFLKARLAAGGARIDRALTVVGYLRMEQVQQFVQLRREYGEFSNKGFDARLRSIVPVPVDKIIWRDRRFYDHEPPLPYFMVMLWDDIFDSLADDILRASDAQHTAIPVTAEDLTAQLQTYYGFRGDGGRNAGIPKVQWVRNALEAFVRFHLAHKTNESQYVVHFRRLRGDKLVRFGNLWNKLQEKTRRGRVSRSRSNKQKASAPGQGKLF